jgi:RHS repeat-associated protein
MANLPIKIKLLLLLLCVGTAVMWAQDPTPQEYFTLGSGTYANQNYVARKSVKLCNGFKYAAASGQKFSAKIDAGLLFPPTEASYQLIEDLSGKTILSADKQGPVYNGSHSQIVGTSYGAIVGAIPGFASVSPTGAANYQIPIDVPVGINGLQPQISIAYNSQGGFGELGMGWGISGTSSISRVPKTKYYDGVNDVIHFDNNDALALDGQRLILLSGTNLTKDAVYATEVENYARVNVLEGFDGIYFQLITKEGKTMEYGLSSSSQLRNANVNSNDKRTLAWKLNSVTDNHGNSMTYGYTTNDMHLSYIYYEGQIINFKYSNNTVNPKNSYITDFLVANNKLLSSITTYTSSSKLKTYGFNYTPDNRLSSVDEKVADNTKLNPTRIIWGSESNMQQVNVGRVFDTGLNDQTSASASLHFADLNGDGYPDRIEYCAGASIRVYINNKTTTYYNATPSATATLSYNNVSLYKQKITTGDINNDGKDEIIYADRDNMKVYSYNGTAELQVNQTIAIPPPAGGYDEERTYDLMVTNVNKDEYNDVVLIYNYNYNTYSANQIPGYHILKGSSEGLVSLGLVQINTSSFQHFITGDFNADGKLDIMGLSDNSNDVYDFTGNETNLTFLSNGKWGSRLPFLEEDYYFVRDPLNATQFSGDFNGDGRTDAIGQDENHDWWLLTNKGDWSSDANSLNEKSIPIAPVSDVYADEGEKHAIYSIDYNGDGLLDLIVGDETYRKVVIWSVFGFILRSYGEFDYSTWYFYKNTGGDFEEETLKRISNDPNRIEKLRGTITDINGDGVADLVLPRANNFVAFTMPDATNCNLVVSVVNGMEQSEKFYYINNSNYAPTLGNGTGVVRDVKAPLKVVLNHSNDFNFTKYSFTYPKMHIEGKGFLGFEKVTASSPPKKTKVVSDYEIQPSYFGVNLLKQTVTTYGGIAISSSEMINSVKVVSATKKRYIPYVNKQTSIDAIKGITQTSTVDYSNYPYSLSQSSTTGDLTVSSATTFTGPNVNTPFLPATVTTTRTQAGSSVTKSTEYLYEYDPTKTFQINKITEKIDPNTSFLVTTVSETPDAFGHLTNISVTASSNTRGSNVAYTSSGRFIASKTNHLGETTTYDWNETLGLLNSETDRLGTTFYKYNNWGQLTETIYPTGIRKTNVLQWATGPSEKYYSYSETSGSAPVWVYYDALGREIRKETKGLGNKKISVFTEYDATTGKVSRVSEPTFNSTGEEWATYAYDSTYGRLYSVTTPMGTTTTSFSGVDRTTTVTTPEGTTITTLNTAGQVLSKSVNDKLVTYDYWPSGLTKTATPQDGKAISMEYNLQGKRTKLDDPDAGITTAEYNAFGEMLWEKDAKGITTTNKYDLNGKGILTSIVRNGETTTYTYDPIVKTKVKSIYIPNKHTQTFSYDAFDRVTSVTEDITANNTTRSYTHKTEYDFFGRTVKEIYPSGYSVSNSYDDYSNLTEVKDNANRSIWKVGTENAKGQMTSITKGNKTLSFGYDDRGLPTSIFADGVIKASYSFNTKGNLEYRTDELVPSNIQKEEFNYDGMNRLTNWDVYKNGILAKNNAMTFNLTSSNIETKSDLGDYLLKYGDLVVNPVPNSPIIPKPGPHALISMKGISPAYIPTADLSVTYTDFKKIATLKEGINEYVLNYGVDDQRRKAEFKENGVTKQTRYYVGDYEEEIDALGNIRKIHYLSGAIMVQENGTDKLYYTYSDNQGSLLALTDAGGTVVERYAYDPWGARRNPDNWTLKDTRTKWITNRGYTGHEHLDAFGIINMNGRVYDPLTAQFFSPDPYLQAPGNWLNYNRYGYCYNNPFKYTDPSGEFFIADDILYAMAFSAIVNLATQTMSGNVHSLGDAGKAGAIGALSGAATAGIGNVFEGGGSVGNELLRAGAHGLSNGTTSLLSGGSFEQGFLSGSLGSLGGSAFQAFGGEFASSAFGTIGFSALSGGIGAELSGGSFWKGAAIGATVAALNHLRHAAQLKLKKDASAEEILDALIREMKVGDEMTAEELGKINSTLGKAKYAYDKLVRTKSGFKLVSSGFTQTSLRMAGGINNNDDFDIRMLKSGKGKIYQVTSPRNTFDFDRQEVPFNIYIHNNQISNQTNFIKFQRAW